MIVWFLGIRPMNILAATFTTAAASEMRDQIGAVVGKEIAKESAISMFHSFCLQLLLAQRPSTLVLMMINSYSYSL